MKQNGIAEYVQELKNCKRCDKAFYTHKPKKIYCSVTCQSKLAVSESAVCVLCGVGFTKTHASTIYCGSKCRKRGYKVFKKLRGRLNAV